MATFRTLDREYIGASARIVQSLGDRWVIKWGCPRAAGTGGQNRAEYGVWLQARNIPDVLDYLAPIVDAAPDGSWLIMERAICAQQLPKAETKGRRFQIEEWGRRNGIHSLRFDLHLGNLGKLANGQVVVIDYGCVPEKKTHDCAPFRGCDPDSKCTYCRLYDERMR